MAAAYSPSSYNTSSDSVFAAPYSRAAAVVRKTNIKKYDAEFVATNEKQILLQVRVL